MTTYQEAFHAWEADIKPQVIATYGADDVPALSESWNDYTDSLCKDGEITDLQYNYCPSWDDEMPDDDKAYILEQMGVGFSFLRIPARNDGFMDDMPSGSSHWRVLIKRGKNELETLYSMGPAHKGDPDNVDVLHSLLMDTSDLDGNTFEEWADSLGYDADSRKAEKVYKACQRELLLLRQLFSESELDDLGELLADH